MSDSQFSPPIPPTPKNSSQRTILSAALAAVVIAIVAVVIATRPDSNSSTESFDSSAQIEESQSGNKYDNYYQYVRNESGMANSESKAMVIEFGDYVCGLFDSGASVEQIIDEMRKYTVGSEFVSEYATAVLFGATTYLCPEYKALIKDYLG